MKEFSITSIVLTAVIFLLLGFVLCFVSYNAVVDHYKELAVANCEYSNNLTDSLNKGSQIIEVCAKRSYGTIPRLDKLNCSLI